jgi:hypothetical protein
VFDFVQQSGPAGTSVPRVGMQGKKLNFTRVGEIGDWIKIANRAQRAGRDGGERCIFELAENPRSGKM